MSFQTNRIVLPKEPFVESLGALESLASLGEEGGEENCPARLLVVDDEPGPREALNIIFSDEFIVMTAASGREALELIDDHSIDVAVLDIRMAEMDGIELLEALKGLDPYIQVIMMTGFETVETACQALRLGACDYLVKPVSVQTIRESVSNALARRVAGLRLQSASSRLKLLQLELDSYRAKIEDARTQNEIYASIVHDLNGPLTIIAGFIDVIRHRMMETDYLAGRELETIKGQLSKINQQIHSGVEISRRYLSFLQSKSALPNPVSLKQILKDLKELVHCHPASQNNTLDIETDVNPELVPAINGTDLIQILLNLTINAFQSTTRPHAVTVTTQILNKPLKGDELNDKPGVCFFGNRQFAVDQPLVSVSVVDQGQGIDPEMLPRIFEPYVTTKKPGQGTGLGLSIVKRLVTRAEGCMQIVSSLNEGTRVSIYLPYTMGKINGQSES